MKIYEIRYLTREGAEASCKIRAADKEEAARLAAQQYDDVVSVKLAKGALSGGALSFALIVLVASALIVLLAFAVRTST